MIKTNRKNFLNCNELLHLLIIVDKVIIYLNNKKNVNISKTFTTYLSLFCLLGSLFFIFIGIDSVGELQQRLQQYQYKIVNMAWAEDINGTENADNITGTQNQDKIKGLAGNDTITGKEAGDNISGGSGDNIIYGNEGRDIVWGKSGNDRIEGGDGNDRIYGDRGNDMLIGGAGNDIFTGGLGKDIFICGIGKDTVTDFNSTQQDSIPENDCENIKNSSSSNINTQSTNNTTTTIGEEKNQMIMVASFLACLNLS